MLNHEKFIHRHIGPSQSDIQTMLSAIGCQDMQHFIDATVPESIRLQRPLKLPKGMSEYEAIKELRQISEKNVVHKSYIGMGYYPTITPNVIIRNVLENPGWYTAYTPYQAEISQGRLEALLNFQQVCIDLTGLDMAGASLLDEATASAEAMAMSKRLSKLKTNNYFVDSRVLPQTIDVMKTRAEYFGFNLIIGDIHQLTDAEYFGALLQYVGTDGDVVDLTDAIHYFKNKKAIVTVASDLMALVLLKSPASLGADIAVGSAQRFGLPMGFGGPHAAYFAFKDEYKRNVPGRIIGVSKDASGQPALRMALQTREQHIRREKATSNVCTSQALLANIAGMYAVYHGSTGLKNIANRIHFFAVYFANAISTQYTVIHEDFFDTLLVHCGAQTSAIYKKAQSYGYNLRWVNDTHLAIAFHEKTTTDELAELLDIFDISPAPSIETTGLISAIPTKLQRCDEILNYPVFQKYHTEHEMLRYLKRLENKDLALTHSMISLGSCTMKLNATAEMLPVTWDKFADIHPFAPSEQTQGYIELINGLESQLKALTGFDAFSFQPNSGAQGEYAGILTIRRFHQANNEGHRDICLIPKSAHGTNPATANMMGMQVVIVATDEDGNIDISDLQEKAETYQERLGALMVTYPSTHGVFEEGIKKICRIIHDNGGQVYMDGANMNAQIGLVCPADIGADIIHLNLHKTFCIPHGGGGPGVGPIGMKAHLIPFIPGHCIHSTHLDNQVTTMANTAPNNNGAIASALYGSASILPVSWMYIRMSGAQGLLTATQVALLNANYIAKQLSDYYPILYTGKNGFVAHECIIDLRPLKESSGISEIDIAKRLMDFGFHAPTMSFPVAGTLMIEPTESESKPELDRFISALKQIYHEAKKVQLGEWPLIDNPLVNAPHTAISLTEEWTHPYSRKEAVYPLGEEQHSKYWPTIARIDEVYGDKNVKCSYPLTVDD